MRRFFKKKWLLQRAVPEFGRQDLCRPRLVLRTDSIFLSRLQEILSPTEKEEAVLVTGVKYSAAMGVKVLVPTSIFMPRYVRQSISGVEAEPEDLFQIEQQVVAYGQEFVLRAHGHPGPGLGMCKPSAEDRKDQSRWEADGYETPSAIFTRVPNGSFYVRFFALGFKLGVEVQGASRALGGGVYEISASPR